jgi:hypothetical protein
VANEHENQHHGARADEEPQGLVARQGGVPSRDFDVANAVEQGRDRQENLRGVGREEANGDVHGERDHDDDGEEDAETLGQVVLRAERSQHVKGRGDEPGEEHEHQLG